jgi:hypothetical protein
MSAERGRMLGSGLLTLANAITVAAPVAADWNDSHIFNERWPAHARFHGVTRRRWPPRCRPSTSGRSGQAPAIAARHGTVLRGGGSCGVLGAVLRRPAGSRHRGGRPAASRPARGGVPVSFLGAAATTVTAAAGWFIDRRNTRRADVVQPK